MKPATKTILLLLLVLTGAVAEERPRARDVGLVVGIFPTGELNAITDVDGVKVGHSTIIEGDDIRTGVTAIVPAPGNLYTHPIPRGSMLAMATASSLAKHRFANSVKSRRQLS